MDYSKIEEKMGKTISVYRENLSEIRAGRANPAVLNKIKIDYYGTPTPINQIAGVSVPEARLIVIQPWDASALKEIEKEGWLKLKGREGKNLSSGEDTELCERVFAQGYSYVSNYKMKLYHIIPQARLEEQYVIRLIDGLVKGRVDFIKSQKFGKVKCLLRKIKYFMEIQIQKNALNAKNLSVEELWKHKVALYQAEAFVKSL